MKLTATHHIAIITPNFEAMETFYTQALGLPVTRRWDDVGIIFIDVGSTTIELIGREAAAGQAPPHPRGEGVGINHIALHVASCDVAFAELNEHGVEILSEPSDFRGEVRFAFFSDPDGNVLELFEELNAERTS